MFRNAQVVTPDDDNDLTRPTDSIYVGEEGNLAVLMGRYYDDQDVEPVIFLNVKGRLDITVRRVLQTGTTAQNIIALRR